MEPIGTAVEFRLWPISELVPLGQSCVASVRLSGRALVVSCYSAHGLGAMQEEIHQGQWSPELRSFLRRPCDISRFFLAANGRDRSHFSMTAGS